MLDQYCAHDSRLAGLDSALKDAVQMVRVSDQRITYLRKMHALLLLKRCAVPRRGGSCLHQHGRGCGGCLLCPALVTQLILRCWTVCWLAWPVVLHCLSTTPYDGPLLTDSSLSDSSLSQ